MEDGRIDENMLALSIGLTTTGVYGLARAVNSEQWYRNIILHDSLYSCEQLLEFVYPELAKQNSWKLPVWYYISKSNMKSELAEEKAPHSYTEIVTESTIKRNRSAIGERTAWEVWTQEKDNLMKAIRLLGCMPEEKIDVNQYRSILQAIFTENNNILSSLDSPNRSNLHRMIRIYDFLEYGQKKTPLFKHLQADTITETPDSWNTGNIASVNRHHHGCTINLYSLYEVSYFLSTTRSWIKKEREP